MDGVKSSSLFSPRFDRHREVSECENVFTDAWGRERTCEAMYRLAFDPASMSMVRSYPVGETRLEDVCETCRAEFRERAGSDGGGAGGEGGEGVAAGAGASLRIPGITRA